jgi:hypothetical protein
MPLSRRRYSVKPIALVAIPGGFATCQLINSAIHNRVVLRMRAMRSSRKLSVIRAVPITVKFRAPVQHDLQIVFRCRRTCMNVLASLACKISPNHVTRCFVKLVLPFHRHWMRAIVRTIQRIVKQRRRAHDTISSGQLQCNQNPFSKQDTLPHLI